MENIMKIDMNHVKKMITMSIFEVFEKMYYIFLEPREIESSDEQRRGVTIQFCGVINGEMHAYYSDALAEAMIENALGIEKEDITDLVREDCLKECMNMICGNFLQKLEPDKVLQLSIPRYIGKAPTPYDIDILESIHLAFETEEMKIDVVLTFKDVIR
jgi:CheY-specific phosphatase CheX